MVIEAGQIETLAVAALCILGHRPTCAIILLATCTRATFSRLREISLGDAISSRFLSFEQKGLQVALMCNNNAPLFCPKDWEVRRFLAT